MSIALTQNQLEGETFLSVEEGEKHDKISIVGSYTELSLNSSPPSPSLLSSSSSPLLITETLEVVETTIEVSVYGVVVFLTLLGNVLVLFTIYRRCSLHNMSMYLVASLSISDLMVGAFVMPVKVFMLVIGTYKPKKNCFNHSRRGSENSNSVVSFPSTFCLTMEISSGIFIV